MLEQEECGVSQFQTWFIHLIGHVIDYVLMRTLFGLHGCFIRRRPSGISDNSSKGLSGCK
jgi:uncharacterized membrane protein YecN with MAPEG domain